MKKIKIQTIKGKLACLGFLILCPLILRAQTTIAPGNVSGTWTKQGSPYIIKGDINIPEGKRLIIQPGVKVKFKGPFVLNVQGSLVAKGTINDSIIFTLTDTAGFHDNLDKGWIGIHFDSRPVFWDTIQFNMPEDEEIRSVVVERIKNRLLDTTKRIILGLQVEDMINDAGIYRNTLSIKQSSRIDFCRFEYGSAYARMRPYVFGGSIYIYRYPDLIISNSVFENNRSYAGGAIYCKEAAPVIVNNTFKKCRANSSGGAMVFVLSGPILSANRILSNTSGFNGGGILFYESCPYMQSNTIMGNESASTGGGLYIEKEAEPVITSLTYTDNGKRTAVNIPASDLKLGKDITYNIRSNNGRFLNNLICDNFSINGGGIGLSSASPEFTNNTISNNHAENKGGAFYNYYAAPYITNTIIYGNRSSMGSQMYLAGKNTINIRYSDIESGVSGFAKDTSSTVDLYYNQLKQEDPQFINVASRNYALQKGSPCINSGIGDTASMRLTTLDLKQNNRIYNGVIDMGAIEYNGTPIIKLKSASDTILNKRNEADQEMIINFYPNPNNGCFNLLIYNNSYPVLRIDIFSYTGQKIYSRKIDAEMMVNESFNLGENLPGNYLIQVTSEGRDLFRSHFIKE